MKVKELIERLEGVDGELEVRIYADHGQYPMPADFLGVEYIDQDTYMPDWIHKDDIAEYENPIKIVMIS